VKNILIITNHIGSEERESFAEKVFNNREEIDM